MLTKLKILIRIAQVLHWRPPEGIAVGFMVLPHKGVRIVVHHGPAYGVLAFVGQHHTGD